MAKPMSRGTAILVSELPRTQQGLPVEGVASLPDCGVPAGRLVHLQSDDLERAAAGGVQAANLQSWRATLIPMLAVPFAACGALLAVLARGRENDLVHTDRAVHAR